jgi:tight adherence protein B
MPPLSIELKRCVEEYELGRPIEEALLSLSLRLEPCRALRTFVEAVLVLKQTGGNLIEIIDQIVDSMRAQAAYEAKYRALTAEGRTSGMILGALPLLILAAIVLVQPDYLGSLLADSAGMTIIALAGGLWLAGVVWLARLARPIAS